jgi:hypothetical protein
VDAARLRFSTATAVVVFAVFKINLSTFRGIDGPHCINANTMSADRHTMRTINDFLRGILILLVLGEDNNPLFFKRIDGPHCT